MDLYRFFHPHHNPRLRKRPMRIQEISELELAAKELLLALKRASIRIKNNHSEIPSDLIDSACDATELTAEFLNSLTDLFEEDSEDDLKNLLDERATAPGWEAWCKLLSERLTFLKDRISPIHIDKELEDQEETMKLNTNNELNLENLSDNQIIKIKASA